MKDRIRELMHGSPFRPFTIHLADGRMFRVEHPDYIFAAPSFGEEVLVDDGRGRVHWVAAQQITSIDHVSEVAA
jgi:hypothetical protein